MSSQELLKNDDDSDDDVSSPHSSFEESKKIALNPLLPVHSPQTSWSNRRKVIIAIVAGCLALALTVGIGGGLASSLSNFSTEYGKGANVLVIMTDDQDLLLDSMSVMPKVQSLIGDEGVTYQKHYCTNAWCCPSRVNFFTGRAAHNTNVTSTRPPYGGWPKFTEEGLNENYLPVWLHNAGIRTYYLGKFLNNYRVDNLAIPAHPKGWDNSSMLVDPHTYSYYNSTWTRGSSNELQSYPGLHTTDVTQEKALAFLEDAQQRRQQFFMMVAPNIPTKYKGKFDGRQAPRTKNFNPDKPSGVSWVSKLDKLNAAQIEKCDLMHQHRLANIAALDDMVAELIYKLDALDLLDNTYVLYTSDNGYHIGNHRLKPGKRCPYEEDINIPLLIRGPDVAKGVITNHTSSHTDMAPTILQMLGVDFRADFDGKTIPYTASSISKPSKNEMVNIEFWSAGDSPIGFSTKEYYKNTYKALRLASSDYSFYYSVWCTGEREFYDMKSDSVQMNNRLGPDPKGKAVSYYGRPENKLLHRLDALLMISKSCKAEACREPWKEMFPNGEVSHLQDAMEEKYDDFFFSQPKTAFASCENGYLVAQEGPQEIVPYTYFSRLG